MLALLVFTRRTYIERCHGHTTRDLHEVDVGGHQIGEPVTVVYSTVK